MTGFWIAAALLLLAAFALFAPVLLGKPGGAAIDRQRLNLALHRQRRDELAAELAGRELEALQAELDKDMLGDLAAAEGPGAGPGGRGRGALLAGLACASLLGILLYSMLGRFDLADFRAQAMAAHNKTGAPEFQEMIERLAERLKTDNQDLKGWMLLGRSYQQVEQYAQAAAAYAQAMKLAPADLSIKAAYAEALGESLGGDFTGEPAKIAAEILAKEPKSHGALWLAGAAAAQRGEVSQAIAYLETLRGEFPKDSLDDKHLGKIIDDLKRGAQAEADAAGAEGGAQDAEAPATGEHKSITVSVSLAAALKAKASADDVVFIFARAAAGPPMPLAIVRKQVRDLPVQVTLDDSMSMLPAMSLSSFDRVVIGARISKSGQAMPQPGDLQGLTLPTEVKNGGRYAVEIREAVQ